MENSGKESCCISFHLYRMYAECMQFHPNHSPAFLLMLKAMHPAIVSDGRW